MSLLDTVKDAFLNMQCRGLTITSWLAMHDQTEAVDKVIALGGKREDAIYGAAFANNTTLVNEYLGNAPNEHCLRSAIRGYARGGHFSQIINIPQYKSYLEERVLGAAQAANYQQITPWLQKNYSLLPLVMDGYVDSNDLAQLLNLLSGTIHYPRALYHAAYSGRVVFVEELLKHCKSEADFPAKRDSITQLFSNAHLNEAARGFIDGCHYQEAAAMLERGADISLGVSAIKDYSILEPFWVLYCSVNNMNLATKLLQQLELRLSVTEQKPLQETLDKVNKIKALMQEKEINYLDAKNRVETGKEEGLLVSEEITLPFLLNILNQELNVDFHFDLQSDLSFSPSKVAWSRG